MKWKEEEVEKRLNFMKQTDRQDKKYKNIRQKKMKERKWSREGSFCCEKREQLPRDRDCNNTAVDKPVLSILLRRFSSAIQSQIPFLFTSSPLVFILWRTFDSCLTCWSFGCNLWFISHSLQRTDFGCQMKIHWHTCLCVLRDDKNVISNSRKS